MRIKHAAEAIIEAERLKAEKLLKKKNKKNKGFRGKPKLKNKKKKVAVATDNDDLKTTS